MKPNNNKANNNLLLFKIKEPIRQVEIISFDVFDTLLLRPYLKPTDLFLHLQKIKNSPGFYDARIQAEQKARAKNTQREEITIDDIYREIDDKFKFLMQVEIDFELQVLTQNLEMKQVWDYAKQQNKKIIVASDMYLPAHIIAQALQKNGFVDYDHLYVSSDLGKTKHSGSMYPHILQDLHALPENILHIGDNKQADYQKAKEKGINAFLYQQVAQQFLIKNKRLNHFNHVMKGNLGASILISMQAQQWQKYRFATTPVSYWHRLGYQYAGPVAFGYSKWIESVAMEEKLTHLLFVARDGYTLQKVFSTFNSTIKTSYVYAPRFMNLIYRLEYEKKEKERIIAIVNFYCEKDPELNKLLDKSNKSNHKYCYEFIDKNKHLFSKNAQSEWSNYKNYLGRLLNNNCVNIGSVDTISGKRLSSLNLLQNTLETTITGFYWSLVDEYDHKKYNIKQFIPNYKKVTMQNYAFTKNWEFMEFLMTAPELPVKSILANGEPVYEENPSPDEIIRKAVYPEISTGALDFAFDIKSVFGENPVIFDSRVLIEWVNGFCDYPYQEDIQEMQKIKHASGDDHTDYLPLFTKEIPLKLIITRPVKALKIAKKINRPWRTRPQQISVCLFNPIWQLVRVPFHSVKYVIRRLFR